MSLKLFDPWSIPFRLEFKREGYCHFAVYVGRTHLDGMADPMPCVVHILNNNGSQSGGLFGGKSQRAAGRRGNKDVVMEALLDVWESSQCRIDNSLDTRHAPFPKEEIKKRALDLAVGREDYPPYNLADNNCEHFASWVRNGVKISKQVVKTGTEILRFLVNIKLGEKFGNI